MTSAMTGLGLPPATPAAPATGLGLANQLCDLVQICSYAGGTAIRLHQKPLTASPGTNRVPGHGRDWRAWPRKESPMKALRGDSPSSRSGRR